MAEDEITDNYCVWDDNEFIDELERREANYLNDPSSAYELEESLAQVRLKLRSTQTSGPNTPQSL
jgi:hypothetical protein